MSERELLGLMAAILSSGDTASAECVLTTSDCVDQAEGLLLEIDARASGRREPPTHAYVAGPILGVCGTCGCDIDADAHAVT